jgi:iron complex transport system ATP-binding protein
MIRTEKLSISYDGMRTILDEITFGVERGSFIGIVGPNGSGKTTLIKTLSRLLTPQDGAVYVDGREIHTFSHRELACEIGVVPQETSVGFDFSVRDIVMMGRHPHIERFSSEKTEDFEIVRHAMEITNTLQFADRSINEISGGERQRVIIARALAQRPHILLLDEPTSHLDINNQMEILGIVRNLEGEVTVVAVMHDLNLASHYCDRLILLHKGSIHATGTPREVITGANLREVFGINAAIRTNQATNKPYIIPLFEEERRDRKAQSVHIICGGGSGSELMYALIRRGYRVSTGILCVNDSDFETAEDLEIPCIGEAPFCGISKRAHAELAAQLRHADAVILTSMPVGPGNIENLRILSELQDRHIILYAPGDAPFVCADFSDGEATAIIGELIEAGIPVAHSIPEVVTSLQTRADVKS